MLSWCLFRRIAGSLVEGLASHVLASPRSPLTFPALLWRAPPRANTHVRSRSPPSALLVGSGYYCHGEALEPRCYSSLSLRGIRYYPSRGKNCNSGPSLRALREAISRLDVFVFGRYFNCVIGSIETIW